MKKLQRGKVAAGWGKTFWTAIQKSHLQRHRTPTLLERALQMKPLHSGNYAMDGKADACGGGGVRENIHSSDWETPGYHRRVTQWEGSMPASQISSYGHVYSNSSAELFPFHAENFDLRKRLAVLSSHFFPSKQERTSFFKIKLTTFTSKAVPKISVLNSIKSSSS